MSIKDTDVYYNWSNALNASNEHDVLTVETVRDDTKVPVQESGVSVVSKKKKSRSRAKNFPKIVICSNQMSNKSFPFIYNLDPRD